MENFKNKRQKKGSMAQSHQRSLAADGNAHMHANESTLTTSQSVLVRPLVEESPETKIARTTQIRARERDEGLNGTLWLLRCVFRTDRLYVHMYTQI